MEELDTVGRLLREAIRNFATCKKKERRFYIGKIAAYKTVLDICGEGKYALQCIDEACADIGKTENSPANQVMRSLMRGGAV